jgi:hypothetical protein
MKSANGSPSGVLMGPTPRHMISFRPGVDELNAPMFTTLPSSDLNAVTLSAEIE